MIRDQIITIAQRKGVFRVHRYSWRHDGLRRCLRQMVRDGVIHLRGVEGKDLVYVPAPAKETP